MITFLFLWFIPIKCLWCGVWWPLIGKADYGPRKPGHCKKCGRGV